MPHCPQENDIAECINHILLTAAHVSHHHGKLYDAYSGDFARDAVFKYNVTKHHKTGQLSHTLWFATPPSSTQLFHVGHLRHIPIFSLKKTLELRAIQLRYICKTGQIPYRPRIYRCGTHNTSCRLLHLHPSSRPGCYPKLHIQVQHSSLRP